jgi:hypothetical protein
MSATARAMLPPDTGGDQDLEAVETLIDQMGEQSFPASDPPAWGVVRARLDLAREKAHPDHPYNIPAESA